MASDQSPSQAKVAREAEVAKALWNQQEKKRTGIDHDPQWLGSDLEGRTMNMHMYGELACDSCLQKTFAADKSWWEEVGDEIHLPATKEAKTGPDLHQCFCGYFTFRLEYFDEHLRDNPYDTMAVMGYVERLGRCDVHDQCRRKVVAAMQPQPEGGKALL
ncbi:hypothetical protein BDZ85DRAFT_258473 [Elsinoe ampelina]|uniref:Uncharacterized protein n=1 Tax=Elsinoe ampelina TaxID=302913 RepID=A0A6A6GJU6_9PEZI|nr:hypothetical protein BDZ85DRAFT_258473 [Elsinoe ampelina]